MQPNLGTLGHPHSLNDKCTMIKNLEYMAYGKPVVSYDLKEGRRTPGNGLYMRIPTTPAISVTKSKRYWSLNPCARRPANLAENESKED